MRKTILSFVFIFIIQIGFTQEESFKTDVLKYLDLSGASSNIKAITNKLIDNIPEDKKSAFKKELDTSVENLINSIAEIYMTEFSYNDIKEILKFYATPVGKKLSKKTDILTEKAQKIGEEWGVGLQNILIKYMQ